MPKKTIFIFIASFIIVGAIMLGVYFFSGPSSTTDQTQTSGRTSGYQSFSSSGTGNGPTSTSTSGTPADSGSTGAQPVDTTQPTQTSKFTKITDFAVSGASFFEDTRPLPTVEELVLPQEVGTTTNQPTLTPTPNTTPTKNATQKKAGVKTNTAKGATKIPAPAKIIPKFETVPSLRYVDKITGHIYQMYLDTKAEGKISNSTIPSIYEAIFGNDAKTVIYRYLSSDDRSVIRSFMSTLGGANGEFLPENISDVSVSPDGSKFFYILKNFSGVTGTIRAFNDTKHNQIWSSSFTEWLSQWVGNDKIFLTTKASWAVPGHLFSMSTSNGAMSKVFGDVNGLTTLVDPTGSFVLFSASLDTGPKLGILNIAKHTTQQLEAYGLPEKCVWSGSGATAFCAIPNTITGSEYPDSWYQGLVSFDDHFVSIDVNTGNMYYLGDSANGTPVDATHLFLDKAENTLFFINKKDSTLWSLSLK